MKNQFLLENDRDKNVLIIHHTLKDDQVIINIISYLGLIEGTHSLERYIPYRIDCGYGKAFDIDRLKTKVIEVLTKFNLKSC